MKIEDICFKENTTELNELAKLKLKVPDELFKSINIPMIERNGVMKYDSSTHYYSYLRIWKRKNKLVEQVFAARCKSKKRGLEIQEVQRRIEGNAQCLIKNMYFSRLCGYRTVWDDARPSYYVWNSNWKDEWLAAYRSYYSVARTKLNCLDDVIKYTGYKSSDLQQPVEWVSKWRKFPQLELMGKFGLLKFANNLNFVNKLTDKDFRKYLLKYYDEGLKEIKIPEETIATDLLAAFNKKQNIFEYIANKNANKNVNAFIRLRPNLEDCIDKERLKKYFIHNKVLSPQMYADYIDAINALRLDLNDTKNLYPINFTYWHDLYIEQVESTKNEVIDKNINKVVKIYARCEKTIDNIVFKLAKNSGEMVLEGKAQSNCVGKMGYNLKMAGFCKNYYEQGKGNRTLIVFLRTENDERIATMEYDPFKKKILQLYKAHNQPVNQYVKDATNKWLDEIKHYRFIDKEGRELKQYVNQ